MEPWLTCLVAYSVHFQCSSVQPGPGSPLFEPQPQHATAISFRGASGFYSGFTYLLAKAVAELPSDAMPGGLRRVDMEYPVAKT